MTAIGAVTVVAFVSLLQWGFNLDGGWPEERRLFTYVVLAPLLLLFAAWFGWQGARRFRLPRPFLTGAVLPFLLVAAALGTGALLRSLQIDPVHRFDGWAGWIVVAIAFYPAASVWHLSPKWRVRLTVFGIALAMFAGMVFYSWTARERWRYEFYADHIRENVVALLEVPGFRMTGMQVIDHPYDSASSADAGYVLAGEGHYLGVSLYVESDLGRPSGFGADPATCRADERLKPTLEKLVCVKGDRRAVMVFEGSWFHLAWRGPGASESALCELAAAATIHRWSKHDLRYIPLGSSRTG